MEKYTAHLIISFKVGKDVPVPEFSGVGIYSESVASLTRTHGYIYADVWKTHGKSYSEARENLLDFIRHYTHLCWALPWVDDRMLESRAKLLTAMQEKESAR